MLKNYFKTALRNLGRNRWVTLISILGLSVGMASGLLSFLHIRYEKSFDRFHSKSSRIYRIVTGDVDTGEGWVCVSAPIPPKIKADIPEVEDFVRLAKLQRYGKVVVRYEDNHFSEENFFLADQSLFSVFDLPLIQGEASQVFEPLNGVVISRPKARKIFGDEDPIGKLIRVNEEYDFEVTGIMEKLPANSHLDIDFAVSFQNLETLLPGASLEGNWGQYNYYAYALLRPGADPEVAEGKAQAIRIPLRDYTHSFESLGLQPLADIHFVHNRGNLKPSYNRKYLYIYGAAALGLILIALVNFVNLTTAGSSRRAREVGVRKAIGASRSQLARQFLMESFLLCLISLGIAAALMNFVLLPYVNNLFGTDMGFDFLNPANLAAGLAFILLSSILAGGYIGFFITSFSPVEALRNQIKTGSGKQIGLRDILLGGQFLVSIILIGSSLMISKQMRHISNMNLGLNPFQVLNIPLYTEVEKDKREALKNELRNIGNVRGISLNSFNPGTANWNQTVWWEGQEESESMFIIAADSDFFETVNLKLLEGDPGLIKKNIADGYAYVLNESAKKHIGWEQASGKMFAAFGDDSRRPISGVIEDFHFQSLHNQVKPCLLVVGDITPSQLYLKIAPSNAQETVEAVKRKLAVLLPGLPFEYNFLNEEFARLYVTEQQARKVIAFYTLACILLAIFGLYGLLAFEINERTKEIAIRKILGCSGYHLGRILSKSFFRAVVITGAAGVPAAWWIMDKWLANFNYRTSIDAFTITFPLIILGAIIFLTVALKVWRSMKENIVEELRYE